MPVTFSIERLPGGSLRATALSGDRLFVIASLEDIRDFISAVGNALTDRQYRALGVMAALIGLDQFRLRSNVEQLGRWLDSVYISPPRRSASQDFFRAMGEASFTLRRGPLDLAFDELTDSLLVDVRS